MRFRDQLLLLGAAGIVAMLAMAAIGFWGQMRLAAAAERIAATTEALHNHQTAVAMHAGLRADALDALVASFLADPSSGARIEQALQDHTDGLRSALSRNARLPLEADAIAEIRALYDDLDPAPDASSGSGPVNEFVLVVNDIFKIATEEDPYSATAVMPVYTNAFHTVESGLKTLGTRFEAMHKAQISEIAEVRRQVITAQGIGLAVFAVGLVLASLTIVRRVMDQLGGEPAYAAEVVSRIAAGDFTRDVEVSHGGRSLLGDMKVLRHRLRDFIHAQIELGAAFKQGDTDRRVPSEQMQGSYREMAEAVNMIAEELLAVQSKVLETTAHYAAGDFSIDMERLPGKQASITAAMDQVKGQLSAIKNDILRLSAAASRGDFSARGDANRFEHEFREMVVALNRLMTEADAGLGDVGHLLQALASGDLTQSVDSMYSGAFGVLAANANATVIQLTGIIDRIRIATHAIQSAALDISAGNAELSLRTERQSVSLDETTSSMNRLTAAVQKNADNSRQARELAAGAAQIAVRGGQVVDEVVTTMNGISASSRKIGDIIGVIDGIAFQTNILALNAAVEAARAGEQGRGFAVVATEVRSLAQRSADAAREIKTLIGESVGTVQTGASLVDAAGRTMHEIVAAVERVSAIMGDISQASEDQAAGIEQVNRSVARMDEVTRQNAVMVERATAAAAALKQQSDSLAKAVSTFRLTSAEGAEGLGSGDLSMWEL